MPCRRRPVENRLPACVAALMLGCAVSIVAGCVTTTDDRLRTYNTEDRWRLYNDIGLQDFAQGNYREALESFDLALTFQPQDPALVYNAGQCYDRLGDVKKAEETYTHCLLIDGKNADAHHALVSLLYRTGRKQQANDNIQDWLTREPKSADPYVADAWRLRQEKDYPDAQGRLQQALAIDPNHVRALTDLGLIYELLGMPEFALVLYDHVLQQDKNQVEISERLAQLKAKGTKRPVPQ